MSLFTPVSTRRKVVLRRKDPTEDLTRASPSAAPTLGRTAPSGLADTIHSAAVHMLNQAHDERVSHQDLPPKAHYLFRKYRSRLVLDTFYSWKKSVGLCGTKHNNRRLALAFLSVAPLSHHNSLRQLSLFEKALFFCNRRLHLLGWRILYACLRELRRIDALIPMAAARYTSNFLRRVVLKVFLALLQHSTNRAFKRRLKEKGALHRLRRLLSRAVHTLVASYCDVLHRRRLFNKACEHLDDSSSRRALHLVRFIGTARKHYDSLCGVGSDYHDWRRRRRATEALALFVSVCASYKQIQAKAGSALRVKRAAQFLRNFMTLGAALRERMDRSREWHRRRVARVAMLGFKLNARKPADFGLEPTLAVVVDTSGPVRHVSATRVQALARGFLARQRVRVFRVQRIMATLLMQRAVRVYIAKRRRYGLARHREFRSYEREGEEERRMWAEDCATRFHMYQEAAVLRIQRFYRSVSAKDTLFRLLLDAVRVKSTGFYESARKTREDRRRYLAEEPRRYRIRVEAATMIQKHVRGMFGKARMRQRQHDIKVAAGLCSLQRLYRMKLAKRRLDAAKRALANDNRRSRVKWFRGALMRVFGVRNRRAQRILLDSLDALGLHPDSFEYRLDKLLRETATDGADLIRRTRHEIQGFINKRFERKPDADFLAFIKRDEELLSQLEIRLHDAVRICELGHEYMGYTGLVVRIDHMHNFAEVLLDKQQVLTYVVMANISVTGNHSHDPIVKIETVPAVHIHVKEKAFPIDVAVLNYSKRRTAAACTIQSAWRLRLAYVKVTAKRYEFWHREISRHKYALHILAETNVTAAATYELMREYRVIRRVPSNDYLRFHQYPMHLQGALNGVIYSESNAVAKDVAIQMQRRVDFVLRADLANMSAYFQVGLQRLTFFRKLSILFWKDKGLVARPGNPGDFLGKKGLKKLRHKDPVVTGTERFAFKQLVGSYHVRYDKLVLYQGEWEGMPFVTPFKPHGEGLVIFLSAWRFCRDKVLYLTITRCTGIPMNKHGVYCQAVCAGQIRRTDIKCGSLNPDFHEAFDIDVTDPSSRLIVDLMEKVLLHDDISVGKVEIPLRELADGLERTLVMELKGDYFYEKFTEKEKILRMREEAVSGADKRGFIEIKACWTERLTTDDRLQLERELVAVILLQSQFRICIAKRKLAARKVMRHKIFERVQYQATKLTSTIRMHVAKRKIRVLLRNHKLAIKIQCRIRILFSRRLLTRKRLERDSATKIQALARGHLHRKNEQIVAAALFKKRNENAAFIQRNIRRYRGFRRALVLKRFAELEGAYRREPVALWIGSYGRDPEYGLRRNRRIVFRAFTHLLSMRSARIASRFGVVFMQRYSSDRMEYPVESLPLLGLQGAPAFVSVCLPAFDQKLFSHDKLYGKLLECSYHMRLHIPTSINFQRTIDYYATIIQCLIRKQQARRMARFRRIMIRLLLRYKRRFIQRKRTALTILRAFKTNRTRAATKKVIALMRRERLSARIIQCAVRCWFARQVHWQRRRLSTLKIFRFSSEIAPYLAVNAIEEDEEKCWMIDSIDFADIIINLSKSQAVCEVAVMTSVFASSPSKVTVSVYTARKTYEVLASRVPLLYTKKRTWQKIAIPNTMAKYLKFTFEGNYGDPTCMAIRGITVVRAKEISACIVEDPVHHLIEHGPAIGETRTVTLHVKGNGWPEPAYQWYCDGQLLEGATSPTLRLHLLCPKEEETRDYRCIKCKLQCLGISRNIYELVCGNCFHAFSFGEISEYNNLVHEIKKVETSLHKDKCDYEASLAYLMKASFEGRNKDIERLTGLLSETSALIEKQRRGRIFLKRDVEVTNRYDGEGQYYCAVRNLRGGDIMITRCSQVVVVIVESPQPTVLKMQPVYLPRRRKMRRHWGIYKSILGAFVCGEIRGIVTIRFEDGSIYEGPFVEDKHVDAFGEVDVQGRGRDHYGYFTCPDGRVFEGNAVDNHFSAIDVNGTYKLTVPEAYTYEGDFCDEMLHGIGRCEFNSGDVYEGKWHQNTRFGFGQYKSAEGWVYEGEFNRNTRHGDGSIRWSDGGFYMGHWRRDKRHGHGIMLTRILDLYRGEFVDDRISGHGEMLYSNGSKYVGSFDENLRHGKGKLVEKDGSEYFGEFIRDSKHGDFVVKRVLNPEKPCPLEIRIGEYNQGELVVWKRVINREMTDDFINLFYVNHTAMDSVYSLLLAKHLPNIPTGLDPDNQDVQMIIERIRLEGGKLVSEIPLLQAIDALKALIKPIRDAEARLEELKKLTEQTNKQLILLEIKKRKMEREVVMHAGLIQSNALTIENYWAVEKTNARHNFLLAVEAINRVPMIEFQLLKTHNTAPHYIKKIMDCVSFLLSYSYDWEKQRLLLSNYVDNIRDGDAEALIHSFGCKLVHVYTHFDILSKPTVDFDSPEGKLFLNCLADPRYDSNSFYVESCGKAAPPIVRVIRAHYAFIKAMKRISHSIAKHSKDKIVGSRMMISLSQLQTECASVSNALDSFRNHLMAEEEKLEKLNCSLENADIFATLLDKAYRGKERTLHGLDYYQRLEVELEEKVDALALDSCVEFLKAAVEERVNDERHRSSLQTKALKTATLNDPIKSKFCVEVCLRKYVKAEQDRLIALGKSMDHTSEPGELTANEEHLAVAACVKKAIRDMNAHGNEPSHTRSWVMLSGRVISARCVYVKAWTLWRDEARKNYSAVHIAAWEKVFITPEKCARMAVEARINFRMTGKVKREASIWAGSHADLILAAEATLANEFEELHPSDAAETALEVTREDPRKLKPTYLAQAVCWNKVNPRDAKHALSLLHKKMAAEFQAEFGIEAAKRAVTLINGLNRGGKDEYTKWHEFALQWRSMHFGEYYESESRTVTSLSAHFSNEFPDSTPLNAAKIIFSSGIAAAVAERYPSLEIEAPSKEVFEWAKCWAMKHQAHMDHGLVLAANEYAYKYNQSWEDLAVSTRYFQVGSKLLANDVNDAYRSTRESLLHKHTWLVGYMLNRYGELLAHLDFLRLTDPLKTIDSIGVRPSTLKQMQTYALAENIRCIEASEKELSVLTERLSIWNTYFGA